MKKFGFTLAEVLITLGIIGVIAALTTPALVKNSGTAKIGPSLAKFVNSFETASELMLEKEAMNGYDNAAADMALLSSYLIMTPVEQTYTLKSFDGTQSSNIQPYAELVNELNQLNSDIEKNCGQELLITVDECNSMFIRKVSLTRTIGPMSQKQITVWQLKDGSIMAVIPASNDSINNGTYKGVVAEVLVDIDGNKSENRAGKDVFAFLLDKTGVLIPAGSNAHKHIKQIGQDYVKSYEKACETGNDIEANLACTGKIADNNYKAN